MKTKFFEFDPVIYPFPLIVCKYIENATADEIADKFLNVADKRTAHQITDEYRPTPTQTAMTSLVIDKRTDQMYFLTVLFKPKIIRYGVIAHESLHIATLLGDWLGFEPPTNQNDEPRAYIVGWAANCIGSVLDGRPDMMKGKLYKFEDDATEKN